MVVSKEDILHLADLARLELHDSEIEQVRRDLSAILEYVARLDDLDLDNIEPTFHVLGLKLPLRDDTAQAALEQGTSLENAPHSDGTFFVVPRVV